ncbi:MAG: hypothetical protein LBR35_00550 [Rickettsiales bacterium]|jgi:hypothetical protein|nr:hypothetical protein [Rickettsiales bacterium]
MVRLTKAGRKELKNTDEFEKVRFTLSSVLRDLRWLETGRKEDTDRKAFRTLNNPGKSPLTFYEALKYSARNRGYDMDKDFIFSDKIPTLHDILNLKKYDLLPHDLQIHIGSIIKEKQLEDMKLLAKKSDPNISPEIKKLELQIELLRKDKNLSKEEIKDKVNELKIKKGQLSILQKKQQDNEKRLSNKSLELVA